MPVDSPEALIRRSDGRIAPALQYDDLDQLVVPKLVVKTADETVNNSAVLQNDDALAFAIGANEHWFAEAELLVSSPSVNSDLKVAWTTPVGLSAYRAYRHTNAFGVSETSAPSTPYTDPTVGITFGSVNGVWVGYIKAWFLNGATAGTVQLQWAQNTQTAEDTIVKAGSFLRLTRLS